ncbi:hypothetical protein [Anatilimnocola floriformis]|uniref:hypothetical protein n=1 Tax=Anatilimnocola floriformis TaxID=2948575 RepID=UPI0020C21BE6|nr:hypothetical protein [Anatilimnocola floriformis]
MTKKFQREHYQLRVGGISYSVRLMIGRPGYYGEWYCPLCDQTWNAAPLPTEDEARLAVLGIVRTHHLEKHL